MSILRPRRYYSYARAITAFLVGSVLSFSSAQSGVGVSPPRVELSALPGGQVTQAVNVDNPSSTTALDVSVAISDALLAPDGSTIWVAPGSHPRSLAPWLSVNPLRFELSPTSRTAVNYTITVPSNTPDGTYWAVLFFESAPVAAEEQGQGIAIVSRVRVGHIVYVTVGQPEISGDIVGIRFTPGGDGPAAMRVQFHNSGTGLLRLDGYLEVRDMAGGIVLTTRIEDAASLPGSTHELVFPVSSDLATGEYTVLATLDYGTGAVVIGEARVAVP